MYATEGVDLADIARHVGHASPTTTAGYVQTAARMVNGPDVCTEMPNPPCPIPGARGWAQLANWIRDA